MSLVWLAFSVGLATLMGARGYRKKSLSMSGSVAAVAVGTVHMYSGISYGVTLIVFYLSSSQMTKWRQQDKAKLEEHFKEGGQRTAAQVLASSAAACIFAFVACFKSSFLPSWAPSAAAPAFLAHYACCCADTWASEGGILSRTRPRLITTGAAVPPGTNGGVTPLGTALSAAGGAFMGLVFWMLACLSGEGVSLCGSAPPQDCTTRTTCLVSTSWLLLLGLLAGLLGSAADSLLGATVQYSGVLKRSGKVVGAPGEGVEWVSGVNLLSNETVNVLSAAAASLAGGGLGLLVVGG